MDTMDMLDVMINDKPLTSFGGASLRDYVIGQTTLDNTIFAGTNNTQWIPLHKQFGLREIYITILFAGASLRDAKMQRSRFNCEVCGESEIYIPDDGFWYHVSCIELGDEELVGVGVNSAKIKSQYHFQGIRHDPLKAIVANAGTPFYVESTAPFTACRIRSTVPSDKTSYTITHTQTTLAVGLGQITTGSTHNAVIDGLTQQVRLGSSDWISKTTWTGSSPFIRLTPGENTLTVFAGSLLTGRRIDVEYYPVYI